MAQRESLGSSNFWRLLILCAVLPLGAPTIVQAAVQGEWVQTAPPIGILATGDSLIILVDGTPLLFGPTAGAVQEYHPETAEWSARGSLQVPRGIGATVTALPGEGVLLAGAAAGATAEVYNTTTDTSTVTGSMQIARADHQATLLSSGRVLVSGGLGTTGELLGSSEIYDPATRSWTLTGPLNQPRSGHSVARLPNGNVLVAGGVGASGPLASAEIYDSRTGVWTATSAMDQSRSHIRAATLNDGRILVVGVSPRGFDSSFYDPQSQTWSAGVAIPVSLGGSDPFVAGLVVLNDGTPLALFGSTACGSSIFFRSCVKRVSESILFDVPTGVWVSIASFQNTTIGAPIVGSSQSSSVGSPLAVLRDGRALFAASTAQLFRRDNATPRLTVTPSSVDFGKTGIGALVQQPVFVQNIGGAKLTGAATAVGAPFTLVSGTPFTLLPGESTVIKVQFNASVLGSFSGSILLASNGNWVSVPLTGVAGEGVFLSGGVADVTGTGIAGVTVTLTGAATASAVTDASGHFRVFAPPNNGYNLIPVGAGLLFAPGVRSVLVATQDVSGLDFTVIFSPIRIGVFRNGFWSLDVNGDGQWDACTRADRCINFGAPGDKSVAADWSGTGKTKVGVFRNGIWSLDFNGNGQWDGCTFGTGDHCPIFGQAGDEAVVADWAGSGHANIGVFRGGLWFLDLNGNGQWDGCGADACLAFGQPGDLPVVGDWTGTGEVKIGVFRNGLWFLDRNGNGRFDSCGIDVCVGFGQAGDLPVVGDWSGTGHDRIGVFRDGVWYLDLNGNGQWDGCIVDACIGFGQAGDRPVGGYW